MRFRLPQLSPLTWTLGGLALVVLMAARRDRPSEHFGWPEVDPTGKGRTDPEAKRNLYVVASRAEKLRGAMGVPLKVTRHGGFEPAEGFTDGYRRKSPTSQHKAGKALDLVPVGASVAELHAKAKELHALDGGGLGLYPWGVHLDVGPTRGPWGSTKPEGLA